MRIVKTIAGVLAAAALVLLVWPGMRSTFEAPRREGPSALIAVPDAPVLWLLTRQEEERSRNIGGSTRMSGRWVTDRYQHFHLQAFGADDAQPRWKRTLRVVKEEPSTYTLQSRLLGQQGEVVWIWLCDEVLALKAADAQVLADRATIERINPDLAGLLPRDLRLHTWYGGLIITLVDGRHVRVRSTDFVAEPFTIDDDNAWRYASQMTSTWNGLYQTKDFGVRAGLFDDRWIGLFSEGERKDAVEDGFGDSYRNADTVLDEGHGTRRRFWLAKVGRTREFSEGSHPRLVDLVAIEGTDTWLEGGLLKAPDVPGTPRGTFTRTGIWQETAREPVRLDGGGTLLLYNTRIDAEGRLGLARLDGAFRTHWKSTLPFKSLGARWTMPGRLLLYGGGDYSRPGMGEVNEAIVAIDLATGAWKGWDVAAEAPLAASR